MREVLKVVSEKVIFFYLRRRINVGWLTYRERRFPAVVHASVSFGFKRRSIQNRSMQTPGSQTSTTGCRSTAVRPMTSPQLNNNKEKASISMSGLAHRGRGSG